MKSIELSISEAKKIIKLPNWHNIGEKYQDALTVWIPADTLIEIY